MIIHKNKVGLLSLVNLIISLVIFIVFPGSSLFAQKRLVLPEEKRALINSTDIKNRIVDVKIRKKEISRKKDEIWCELLSDVRSSFYITLVFNKEHFENNIKPEDNIFISCRIKDYEKKSHTVPAGSITTYYLFCEILKPEKPKIFQLSRITENADIDDEFIKQIDSVNVPYPRDSDFQIGDLKIKKGQFRLYKFLSVYKAPVSFSTKEDWIHDILLIKTDNKNIIKEAYHYTLEWSDSPSLDLYFSKKLNSKLSPKLNIKDFQLKNSEGRVLKENALMDNVIDGKKVF